MSPPIASTAMVTIRLRLARSDRTRTLILLWFRSLRGLCTGRSGGRRGAAAWVRGSWGTRRKRVCCRASWARRFCVRALECRLFGFGIALISLLRLTSVLDMNIFQSHPAVVARMGLAMAVGLVAVGAANRADSLAGLAANASAWGAATTPAPSECLPARGRATHKILFPPRLRRWRLLRLTCADSAGSIEEIERSIDMKRRPAETAVALGFEIWSTTRPLTRTSPPVLGSNSATPCGRRAAPSGRRRNPKNRTRRASRFPQRAACGLPSP